jgi:hypothetical protein
MPLVRNRLWSDLKAKKKNRRAILGGSLFAWNCASLSLDGTAALPVLALLGHELEPHPLGNNSAQESHGQNAPTSPWLS